MTHGFEDAEIDGCPCQVWKGRDGRAECAFGSCVKEPTCVVARVHSSPLGFCDHHAATTVLGNEGESATPVSRRAKIVAVRLALAALAEAG